MEYIDDNNFKIGIESLSKIISEKWNMDDDVIRNYIFANISLCLARNINAKKDIEKIYITNELRFYNSSVASTTINHVIMMQGTFEEQIYARRILGILLEAEYHVGIRNKVIKLLKKYYPIIYDSVRKRDKEKIKNKYMKMDIINRNIEGRFDAAIYFYFATYLSSDMVDQGFIISILSDMEDFELRASINQNINDELEKYKDKIQEIKSLIKRKCGKLFNIKDICRNSDEKIRNSGEFFEALFLNNKLNINYIFHEIEFVNIDRIILSYVRVYKDINLDLIIQNIISGIFMQVLLNEYKNVRKLYFESSGEVLNYKLKSLEESVERIIYENNNLKTKIGILDKEKSSYDKNLHYELNKLSSNYKLQIKVMEEKIRNLEKKLNEEKNIRQELEALREYELKLDNVNTNCYLNKSLRDYINKNKIIIIGGDKEWRRRFRAKYPEIRTLNGFNENFDLSILNNVDYIFFYTKYMNHSTFHKAMNFIKLNRCNFGYIGKTNMELVEEEIIENINKYEENSNI